MSESNGAIRSYIYRIRTTANQTKTGTVKATSLSRATDIVVALPEFRSLLSLKDAVGRHISATSRAKSENLVAYIDQIGMAMSAGIGKEEAMGLARAAIAPAEFVLAYAAAEVEREVTQEGALINEAMRKFPGIFPRPLIETVSAGERSGKVGPAFEQAAKDLTIQTGQLSKIKQSLKGPLVNLVLVLVITAGLIMFGVPVFTEQFLLLGGTEEDMPFATKLVVGVADQAWWAGPLLAAISLTGYFMYRTNSTNPKVIEVVDRWKLKLPVLGPIFLRVAQSRFCFTFTTLDEASLSNLEALEICAGAVGNNEFAKVIDAARIDSERNGTRPSAMLAKSDLFSPVLISTFAMSVETGKSGDSLRRIGERYALEVDQLSENVGNVINPAMTIVTGIIVGVVGLAMLMPIFQLSNLATPY